MYQDHFNFSELPFTLTPNKKFFVDQFSHKAALNTLLVSLKHSEGFIKIVGEVGTGKTMLSRVLLERLGDNFKCAYIPNPYLTPQELKGFVAQEIGLVIHENTPSHQLMGAIYRKLIQLDRADKQVVIVVDEAQTMPKETLECLRLLTNLETQKRKLIQVVIIGQPELDTLLKRKDLRQLRQRIVFSEYLHPFQSQNAALYIKSRLSFAGDNHSQIFSNNAIKMISTASMGIPRLINIICHKSLLSAYGKNKKTVNFFDVARAITDTCDARKYSRLMAKIVILFAQVKWPASNTSNLKKRSSHACLKTEYRRAS